MTRAASEHRRRAMARWRMPPNAVQHFFPVYLATRDLLGGTDLRYLQTANETDFVRVAG